MLVFQTEASIFYAEKLRVPVQYGDPLFGSAIMAKKSSASPNADDARSARKGILQS